MIESDDLTLLRSWCDDRADTAFAELVRRHAVPVREACRRRLRDPADAEDAAQAVFLILASKAPGIVRSRWWSRPVIGDWLYRTAQNVCSNHERQRRRRERHEREAALAMATTSDPSAAGIERLRERVDVALAALPARYRQPVVLHYLEGHARAEVANALGLSEEALRKRLQRALEMLRGRLGAAEGSSTGLIAALAPLHAEGGAQTAAAIHAYLHGAPIPAVVSIHVTGGLHAMRLAIAKTALASCLGLAVAGGALAVVHAESSPAPAPAQPPIALAQHPKIGAVLYWDSLLDWTFDLGGSNPGQPEQWMVPRRMLEYVIFRAEVKAAPGGGELVSAAPVIGWRIIAGKPDSVVAGAQLRDPEGRETHVAGNQSYGSTLVFSTLTEAHPEQFQFALGDDQLRRPKRDSQISEYGPLLDGMGVPDLLLPLPRALWTLGEQVPLQKGTVQLVAADPPVLSYAFDHFDFPEQALFTHTEQVFGQNVEILVLVGATGAGKATARWDAVAGLPTETASSATYQVRMRSRQAAGAEPMALLSGTLTLARQASLLHPTFAGAPTLQAIAGEVRRERLAIWWRRLQQPGDQPLLHDLAFSVLLGLENPPRSEPPNSGVPAKSEF